MIEHVVREFCIDEHSFGLEIRGDAGQAGATFGRLDFEIGVSEERGHCAQHHRSDKRGHRGDALGHDDDHPITKSYAVIPKCPSLLPGTAAKVGKGQRLALVFIDPDGDKWTAGRSRIERVDEIAELHRTLLHSGIESTCNSIFSIGYWRPAESRLSLRFKSF